MRVLAISTIIVSIILISSLGVYAEISNIPDWVKNNAKWWAEGQIGESDFISAMQYLINQGVITIPVKHAVATDVNLSDNERAMYVVVHFEGEIFGQNGETIYTYSEFQHISSTVSTSSSGIASYATTTPAFYLSGLPSLDKKNIYRLVDEYVNPGRPPTQYQIKVDILTADATLIQTWDYRKCDIVDYFTYLDSSELNYRFADKDESEIREVLVLECAGFRITVD